MRLFYLFSFEAESEVSLKELKIGCRLRDLRLCDLSWYLQNKTQKQNFMNVGWSLSFRRFAKNAAKVIELEACNAADEAADSINKILMDLRLPKKFGKEITQTCEEFVAN